MVGIGLDYHSNDWQDAALRVLRAGGSLTGIPTRKAVRLQRLASREGLELKPVKTPAGWKLKPEEEQD